MTRIIRFEGQIIREQDALNFLVSRGMTSDKAAVHLAKCPSSELPPVEARHFLANFNREERDAAEWNARQQHKADRRA